MPVSRKIPLHPHATTVTVENARTDTAIQSRAPCSTGRSERGMERRGGQGVSGPHQPHGQGQTEGLPVNTPADSSGREQTHARKGAHRPSTCGIHKTPLCQIAGRREARGDIEPQQWSVPRRFAVRIVEKKEEAISTARGHRRENTVWTDGSRLENKRV